MMPTNPNVLTYRPMTSSKVSNALYGISRRFLSFEKTAPETLRNVNFNLPGKYTLATLAEKLGSHDFHQFSRIPGLGRYISSNPRGAFLAMTVVMVGGRIKHAIDRAIEGDNREFKDILRRDIPTVGIIVYALAPITRAIAHYLVEPLRGFSLGLTPAVQLRANGTPDKGWLGRKLHTTFNKNLWSSTQLDLIYNIQKEDQLMALMQDRRNRKGVEQSLNAFIRKYCGSNGIYNQHIRDTLIQYRNELLKGFHVMQDFKNSDAEKAVALVGRLRQHARNAFQHLNKLESERMNVRNANHASQSLISTLIGEARYTKYFRKELPSFNRIFSNHARQSWLGLQLFAFTVMFGLLGAGIPYLNKVLSEREFKQRQKQMHYQPQFGPASFSINR